MEAITDFKQIIETRKHRTERKKVAVVWAADATTRNAVTRALEEGIADIVFVGCKAEIEADKCLMSYCDHYDVIEAEDCDDAAAKAVSLAREGNVDVIMKGMLNTDNLLRAVLNKQTGILAPRAVLSHVTVAEIPAYGKLLIFADAAVIPFPTEPQVRAEVEYVSSIGHKLGIDYPRIALVHCSEKIDGRHFPVTEAYAHLREMAHADELGDCIVDGPLDVKTACSKEALLKKGLSSPVDGYADGLIFPDIEAGNVFYKTITLFGGATTAGLLMGASVPVVLPSRGDSNESKFNSIALAVL